MRAADVELLAQAGLAHDLGKSVVPAEVLNKQAALDQVPLARRAGAGRPGGGAAPRAPGRRRLPART
jgi:hypothetical protein